MNNKKEYFLLTIMCLVLFPTFLNSVSSFIVLDLGESGENENINTSKIFLSSHYQIDNDTVPPSITFIQPSLNNTVIPVESYTIIIEIVDENAPLIGDVIVEISDFTSFLFNASMNYAEEDSWTFNWDNITSYDNYKTYIIRIWARDSSLNRNYIWSPPFYLIVSISSSPPVLNVILYILFVILIFVGIVYYLTKKRAYILRKKKLEG
jgi:hypothetical protein